MNPYLDTSIEIRWKALTPEKIVPGLNEAIDQAKKALDNLKTLPLEKCTYENTFEELESIERNLARPWSKVSLLNDVCNSKKVRQAYNEILPKITAFFSALNLDTDIWIRLKSAKKNDPQTDSTRVRFIEETSKSFIDAGADLPKNKKKRISQIDDALSKITQKFSENVLDSTNDFQYTVEDEKDLAGLPENAKETAKETALAKGIGTIESPKYLFTLQFPSYGPTLKYLDSENIRKALYKGNQSIGFKKNYDNTSLIKKILDLRQEKAEILGHSNFCDLILKNRMAKTGERAIAFIEDLHSKTKDAFLAEQEELENFKAEKTGKAKSHLLPWELAYWMEKLRNEKYDFDEKEVEEYFPIESVESGLFQISESLFGIKVVQLSGQNQPEVWHPDVKSYEVYDKKTNKRLGLFYTDWYPRETKRSGAWMNPFHSAWLGKEEGIHIGLICGNLTKPVSNKPALLNHREVETIFHEFGHLLHHLLSEIQIPSLGGTNVAWDFVELPSQIMENWAWERKSLDLFARHYQTNETIPEPLYQKMLKARNFGAAYMQMRQLGLAIMDLKLHFSWDKNRDRDLELWIEEITKDYKFRSLVKSYSNIRSFNHLFSNPVGYGSGYYSYKWAEVLDADAFQFFKDSGILNHETGMKFRKTILAKGNAKDPLDTYIDFAGREPDPQALLKRQGLN